MSCPACDAPLPSGARFCPACGESITAARIEERRVVTVLFADIVGFTGLAEHRDPEMVKRMVDGCMDTLAREIAAFGGTVDKFLGDGVLALFGAPLAHEDDAERAVRCALRMQEVVGGATGPDGAPLRLRIGVNTGEVLVGALRARADYTAMGDAVNTAARLQALAPPGRVLVGEATHHLTVGAISYESVGAVLPRGREQVVEAWLAIAPTALPGGRRHRFDLPIVGRDPELGVLHGAIALAGARRRAALVVLEGDGGVGKSRLVAEVVSRARDELGAATAEGACVPYGEDDVWWPLTSAFAGTAEPGSEGAEFAYADLVALVRDRLALGSFVLTITDLHWADPAVLVALEKLLSALADQPLILVTTLRPHADVPWPPSGGSFSTYRMRLDPLGRDATAEYLEAYLGAEVDPVMVDRLFERSGGNPLFLEELAGLIAEHGPTGDLPDSLRALIAARLDQLPVDQRAVLDNAAVLGSTGRVSALVQFGRAVGLSAGEEAIRSLVDAGLLTLDRNRWSFRSESVREVAYQTLTKAARAQRHAGVAQALLEQPSAAKADEIAHHLATAAELVGELGRVPGVGSDVSEQAINWLTEAASRSVDQMYTRVAITQASRAIELVEVLPGRIDPAARRRLSLVRAAAYSQQRDLARARADVAGVLEDPDSTAADRATAERLSGEIDRFDGRLPSARMHLDRSIGRWREVGDERGLAETLRARGMLEVFGPNPSDSAPFLDEADELYVRLGDRAGHAWVEQNRAWESFLAGRVEEADERLHRAAAVMEELGNRSGIGWAFGLLAFVRFYLGNREEAGQLADSVQRDALDRGDEWAVAMMQALQANLQLWEGHMTQAIALSDEAVRRMRRLGDGYGQIQALAPGVRALVAAGRYGEARMRAEEIHALAPRFGLEPFAALSSSAASLHVGAAARSLERTSTAIAHDAASDGPGSLDAWCGRALGQVLLGELDEAAATLAMVEPRHHERPYVSAVIALAAAADGRLSDAMQAAQRVMASPAATYLDRVHAGLADSSARLQSGDRGAALAALEPAWLTVSATDDLVTAAVVARARARLGLVDEGPLAERRSGLALFDWATLIDRLFPEA